MEVGRFEAKRVRFGKRDDEDHWRVYVETSPGHSRVLGFAYSREAAEAMAGAWELRFQLHDLVVVSEKNDPTDEVEQARSRAKEALARHGMPVRYVVLVEDDVERVAVEEEDEDGRVHVATRKRYGVAVFEVPEAIVTEQQVDEARHGDCLTREYASTEDGAWAAAKEAMYKNGWTPAEVA